MTRTLLHVCGRYLPLSETFTYDLIRRLDGFTHHVVAASLENLDVFPLASVQAPVPEATVWPAVRDLGVDGVVCHFGPQCTMGMPIAMMLGVPIVTVFHGYDISRLLQDRVWVERYRACFEAGMRALCISDAGRRKLLDIGCPPTQVDVIRLGVDTRRFTFKPPSSRWPASWTDDRPLRLLSVARLVPKKGMHVALAASALLDAAGRPHHLRIVGDGPERAALEAQAESLGLRHVTWMGAVPRDVTAEAFAWADLYVQPSVTAESGDEEGIPVSLMEAMAAGLPVVSTRHSGIPELVIDGHTGVLTDEGDIEGLAHAIAALAVEPERAEALARAGRQWVEEEFDQRRQVARTGRWLERMLLDPVPPRSAEASREAPAARALVIQSIDAGLLGRKLTTLAYRHPGVTFDLLATDASAQPLAALPFVGDVLGPVTVTGRTLDLSRAVRHRLQSAGYDTIVVPYSDERGQHEQPAADLAAALGPRRILGLTLRDREVPHAATVPS